MYVYSAWRRSHAIHCAVDWDNDHADSSRPHNQQRLARHQRVFWFVTLETASHIEPGKDKKLTFLDSG